MPDRDAGPANGHAAAAHTDAGSADRYTGTANRHASAAYTDAGFADRYTSTANGYANAAAAYTDVGSPEGHASAPA